jgi:hypothetical protein
MAMRFRIAILWLGLSAAPALVAPARAQTAPDSSAAAPESTPAPTPAPAAAAGGSGAALTNPAISVIGWFQGAAGNDRSTQENAFSLRESELALQSAVDPYAKADFILSFSDEGVDVEEGYLTWLSLPGGGRPRSAASVRTWASSTARTWPRRRSPIGPGTARVHGEEGLSTEGLSLSAILPTGFYWDATLNVGTAPGPGESPVFGGDDGRDLLWLGRTSAFVDLSESSNLNLGLSYANARADSLLRSEGAHAQLGVVDLTFRWKNPRRSIYRSLTLQSEYTAEQGSDSGAPGRDGWFAYGVYQFARRWKMGARYDSTDRPALPGRERGALALLQYQPSEFSTVSLQARRTHDELTDTDADAAFLKWTFNIGPHGAHPY